MVNHPNRRARRPFKASIELHSGGGFCGYCVMFYTDDDAASGYGENPMRAFWYGNRQQCETIKASGRLPRGLYWRRLGEDRGKSDLERHETHADNH